MLGDTDNRDQNDSRKTAIALIVLVLMLVGAAIMMLPALGEIVAVADLNTGLGLKDAAVIAFFVTLVVMIVLAVAAGDGLIGEVQYMIGGFFTFFIFIWLMLAWVF
ncbi:hypothetical protein [Solemya velum gill symbiont]|uniref:Uncharacterized protein n=1 Tax=Solemya velum gill symbiont TaxID=2340 RepID=A0A1T2PDS8_SOVGS|nr:hypothetical protein [Solemya velum gill symbiont]OOY35617.1 hypothetical protein BOV88_04725 [Solemya velum gill symbiont]OOY38639.1 hypothetical protein BOV89_01445 [Solemya velum gill symbiont]OOY40483.1 hypothetical protein BOV90_03890 [Solemya velum gill symbiont]OOY41985.1 hypothetical protein BOV91_08580 [Solemya velum gill symbiont]OOY45120.1 hypothetical protein BOV92_06605 [Solemya velum gill symbiont]